MFSLMEEQELKKLHSPGRNTCQDYLGHVLKNLKGQNYRHRPQMTEKYEAVKEICIKALHSFGNKDTGRVY